ncbi:Vacuolar membrane zinc transporter [Hyphodiscus hymeniophilus]|uniref:Vacuolar membrane zinc transporter n=1 Tax=Hyphodiscus hymeniophilus TaxID=353542 RepID=A0A9P6VH74_9HELO|nr:Vacuolar membrane zinc transporter [Hyphodiscus hymeniophilus]
MDTKMNNDTRGWIMTIVSGIACVIGASIICVDLIIRQIPSKRDFRIQDSNVFLAGSLSLSFGVMIFSALYSMLPSSKNYLIDAGFIPSTAAWILLGCFMGGFVGIQIVSRFLHHYIPSHVEQCDHTHKESFAAHGHGGHMSRTGSHARGRPTSHSGQFDGATNSRNSETSPLLSENGSSERPKLPSGKNKSKSHRKDRSRSRVAFERRPSMMEVPARVMSFVKDRKNNCDEGGPCFGYTDPCGQECFKHIGHKTGTATDSRHPSLIRTHTGNFSFRQPNLSTADEEDEISSTATAYSPSLAATRANTSEQQMNQGCESDDDDLEGQHTHHHHVPENAFMAIGLQTSIAIALHKLPEGFITYATNHANPSLGLSVFMALFIHNITEGFAMALPLYLALGSRLQAMLWASLLGGISQPLGAGIAALWFKIAGHDGHQPGSGIYGGMFAITAGIMTSVALQLFVEGLSLNHNRNLCVAFAFIGMAMMGTSGALTA